MFVQYNALKTQQGTLILSKVDDIDVLLQVPAGVGPQNMKNWGINITQFGVDVKKYGPRIIRNFEDNILYLVNQKYNVTANVRCAFKNDTQNAIERGDIARYGTVGKNLYFTFLIDEENQKACLFAFWQYYNDTTNDWYTYGFTSEEEQTRLFEWFGGKIDESFSDEPQPEPSPYAPGAGDYDKGGDGDFDKSSDPIPIPALPSISLSDTGLCTVFNPSLNQVKAMAQYLWSDLFSLNTFKKLIDNPIESIIGLNVVPFTVPHGGMKTVAIGNIPLSGIQMPVANSTWLEFDCGIINIGKYTDSYMDYEPYTKAQIYLPFIGYRNLSMDDIVNTDLHLVYHCDAITGACMAYLQCGNAVKYEWSGQCSMSVPLSGSNYNEIIRNVMTAVVAVGAGLATGGVGAVAVEGGAGAGMVAEAGLTSTIPEIGNAISSTADTVMSAKPQIERSGSISGVSGLMGVKKPHLIITRPNYLDPTETNEVIGIPAFKKVTLNSCHGFTRIYDAVFDGLTCTDEELNEMINIMKGGIIL